MPAVPAAMTPGATVERAAPVPPPLITTLYDLIATLTEDVEPWEDEVVTAAVVHLCQTGRLRFLGMPAAWHAGRCLTRRTGQEAGPRGRVLVAAVLMGGEAGRRSRAPTSTTLAGMPEDIPRAAGDHRQDVLEAPVPRRRLVEAKS
jgi:hypothetical protein